MRPYPTFAAGWCAGLAAAAAISGHGWGSVVVHLTMVLFCLSAATAPIRRGEDHDG